MMIGRSVALRRVLLSQRRTLMFHTSSVLGADALDAVDTFARRHSKSATSRHGRRMLSLGVWIFS